MEKLPTETLTEVFELVRLISGPSALTVCALCCKKWRAVVLPVLYRDVVLSDSRLASFAAFFPRAYGGPLVRSLTLIVGHEPVSAMPHAAGDAGDNDKNDAAAADGSSAETRLLWRQLRDVAAVVAGGSMAQLAHFSLRVTSERTLAKDFWLPRPLLSAFVAGLPASCVAVEIDTLGFDAARPAGDGDGAHAHFCDVLRGVVPRLRHLRLRLKVLCPAIFIAGGEAGMAAAGEDGPDGEGGAEGQNVVVAPALKTLVINCVTKRPGYGGPSRLCGTLDVGEGSGDGAVTNASGDGVVDPHNFYYGLAELPQARVALARCLRRLYTGTGTTTPTPTSAADGRDRISSNSSSRASRGRWGSSFPAIERLWLLDMQLHDNDDASVYAAFNRRDVAANRTWAIPFRNICAVDPDAYLTRTADGRELLSFLWAIEALAEGETWVEMREGVRVPAAAAAAAATVAGIGVGGLRWGAKRALPLRSAQEYHERFPRRSCALWANERKTGITLLGATQRDGLIDTTPLREQIPPGWRRDEMGDLVPLLLLPPPAG
jgi:hypothetical protein